MKRSLLLVLVLLLIMTSCKKMGAYDKELTFIKVSELNSATVSDKAVAKLLKEQLNADITIHYTLSEDTAFQQLVRGEADFAIIPNNAVFPAAHIRTVAPLLPRVLLVLTKNIKEYPPGDLRGVLEGHHLVMEDLSRIDSIFMRKLFTSYGIDPAAVEGFPATGIDLDEWKDSSFVYIGLTHLHNPKMKKLIMEGARFFSLDDISLYNRGSSVEGFKMNYSRIVPFILPKDYFLGRPASPVLTLAIPDILVTREDVSKTLVYDIVSTIVEQKPRLEEMDNIYALLNTTDLSGDAFSFPLHKGTQDYIMRNEPSLMTRYASDLWPVLSVLAIFSGALASVRRRMRMRKKLSIESFYKSLLSLRKKSFGLEDEREKMQILEELRVLRSEAFEALIENRLMADETFEIFLSLYDEVRKEIE